MPVLVHCAELPAAATPAVVALSPTLDCLALVAAAGGAAGGGGGAGGGQTLVVVRWLTWQRVLSLPLPVSSPVAALAWSPDGAPPPPAPLARPRGAGCRARLVSFRGALTQPARPHRPPSQASTLRWPRARVRSSCCM